MTTGLARDKWASDLLAIEPMGGQGRKKKRKRGRRYIIMGNVRLRNVYTWHKLGRERENAIAGGDFHVE